jgi:hypothetical protein
LQNLREANEAPAANAINFATAQDVYFRGMWMALAQSDRRYGGKIVEAEDFVEQVFRDRQLKYCRDGRVSGGARRRRSMTGIGYAQTQPPSTM